MNMNEVGEHERNVVTFSKADHVSGTITNL